MDPPWLHSRIGSTCVWRPCISSGEVLQRRSWRCRNFSRKSSLFIGGVALCSRLQRRSHARPQCRGWEHKLDLPRLTADEERKLKENLHVQRQTREGPQGQGMVVFDVHAPAALVLERLADFENYPAMIPVVRKATVHCSHVADDGSLTAHCSYRISRFYLAVHNVSREEGLVRFDLDPTVSAMMLNQVTGFWYVEALETEGVSRVWLRVDLCAANWLPHWLIDYASERALTRATAWLKPNVEELWHLGWTSRVYFRDCIFETFSSAEVCPFVSHFATVLRSQSCASSERE
eukprot:Skav223540  [mRNA]  locus=scaffold4327:43204:47174:- [translate_table: standard]